MQTKAGKIDLDLLTTNLLQPLPTETIPLCPFCHVTNVDVERMDDHYPYYRCYKCGAGFYKVEIRSYCNLFQKGVTQQQCAGCQAYQPDMLDPSLFQKRCINWAGVLPPPPDVAEAIKQQLKNLPKIRAS